MLKPPYMRYSRIYTYHLDGTGCPFLNDPDLIGIWEESGKTILIFHKPKDRLVQELCRQSSWTSLSLDLWNIKIVLPLSSQTPMRSGSLKAVNPVQSI